MIKNIAVITGASGGMGREFALTVEKHGKFDEIWAISRNEEKLNELADRLVTPVRVIAADLTEPESFDKFRSFLEASKPRVGLLINCSGFGKFEASEAVPLEDSLGMIDLNCRALTALTLISLPFMTEGSKIINIASVAGLQPVPYINVYAATKAYVLSFSRALAREVKPRGIRVLAVCPFWTKTAFFDRAIDGSRPVPVVKKYAAMYRPEFIVKKTWKALESTKRDYVVPGFKASMQAFGVKVLPHRWVMDIWLRQQRLDGR
jgi:short-subunit dehydrogenase